MPLFSVVIPLYNRAHLVGATLESVFAQTFSDYEVIVVDDGSTDGGEAVVRGFGERVRYIRQENAGPGVARNRGIEAATGEYIAFLDSDDLWFPWTLETYAQAIHDFNRPAFMGGKLFPFTEEAAVAEVPQEESRFDFYRDYLEGAAKGIYVSSGMACVKTQAAREIGGFIDMPINAEDHDFAIRMGIQSGFLFVDAPVMVGVRSHAESLTGNISKTVAGIQYLIAQESAGKYPGGSTRSNERHFVLAQHVRPVSLRLMKSGDLSSAWSLYWKTLIWQAKSAKFKYVFGFPLLASKFALIGK